MLSPRFGLPPSTPIGPWGDLGFAGATWGSPGGVHLAISPIIYGLQADGERQSTEVKPSEH